MKMILALTNKKNVVEILDYLKEQKADEIRIFVNKNIEESLHTVTARRFDNDIDIIQLVIHKDEASEKVKEEIKELDFKLKSNKINNILTSTLKKEAK